jgi:predicted 3-demethylubiquinone-9 3-methyltransferase (glyoxalase superfamily)
MQNLLTCLGFNNRAEDAVNFYVSTIRNSRIVSVSRAGKGTPLPEGSVLAIAFVLDGVEFLAINGGPPFSFSIGTSIMVRCDTQAEIDRLWETLSEGGQQIECGWVTDKFGLSWQIVPARLGEWMSAPPEKSQAVMKALLRMKKLDMATLQRAYDEANIGR